ncbi:mechanosensitive ion channel family protein [Derxia gummosa]|uniref:Mechanosensitive ion channel family protein n=1 Tax=Derxia gummosa DSM 723 TaxID=1121388 RepID=A0A8B6XBQ8_9BURK|nr:mechanosensitive ion channel family protein [Derxia gummosa]
MPTLSSLSRHDPWIATLIAAGIALAVAFIVFKLGDAVIRRAVARSPVAQSVARSARHPAAWALPVAALEFVFHAAPDSLDGIETVRHASSVLLIGAVTWLLVRCVRGFAAGVIGAHPSDVADNLNLRRLATQTRVLARTAMFAIGLIGTALICMTFPSVRQIGASLLASAGVAGLIAGIAARPVLGNLIAGLQIGLAQPIRLDDVVIVEGEWGWIEEITGTYVVVRLWDQRRLVVPLQWWIEHPFQNWTRNSSELIGTVFLWVDYRMPLDPLRAELKAACEASPDWDGRVALLQVTEAGDRAMQLRCLVSAASSPRAWDLRCHVRERLLVFMQRDWPQYLPRLRAEMNMPERDGLAAPSPAAPARGITGTEMEAPQRVPAHAPEVRADRLAPSAPS